MQTSPIPANLMFRKRRRTFLGIFLGKPLWLELPMNGASNETIYPQFLLG
jgi:hypothetical protein